MSVYKHASLAKGLFKRILRFRVLLSHAIKKAQRRLSFIVLITAAVTDAADISAQPIPLKWVDIASSMQNRLVAKAGMVTSSTIRVTKISLQRPRSCNAPSREVWHRDACGLSSSDTASDSSESDPDTIDMPEDRSRSAEPVCSNLVMAGISNGSSSEEAKGKQANPEEDGTLGLLELEELFASSRPSESDCDP